MFEQHLELAWRSARVRFSTLADFVGQSAKTVPPGDVEYRNNLFASWVLLLYAATESAIANQGRACVRLLGSAFTVPTQLPEPALKHHRLLTLSHLAEQAKDPAPDFPRALSALEGEDWAEHTRLLHLPGNVWPDVVTGWLGRLGIFGAEVRWMQQPRPDGDSETIASRVGALVAERNAIAHGEGPTQLLSRELAIAWLDDARFFVRAVVTTLQQHLVNVLDLDLPGLGQRDLNVRLGAQTIALLEMHHDLHVDSHVVVVTGAGQVRVARVRSIYQGGVAVDSVVAGAAHVAVNVSRDVRHCAIFTAV